MVADVVRKASDVSKVREDMGDRFVGYRVNSYLGKLLFQLGIPVVLHIIICSSW